MQWQGDHAETGLGEHAFDGHHWRTLWAEQQLHVSNQIQAVAQAISQILESRNVVTSPQPHLSQLAPLFALNGTVHVAARAARRGARRILWQRFATLHISRQWRACCAADLELVAGKQV